MPCGSEAGPCDIDSALYIQTGFQEVTRTAGRDAVLAGSLWSAQRVAVLPLRGRHRAWRANVCLLPCRRESDGGVRLPAVGLCSARQTSGAVVPPAQAFDGRRVSRGEASLSGCCLQTEADKSWHLVSSMGCDPRTTRVGGLTAAYFRRHLVSLESVCYGRVSRIVLSTRLLTEGTSRCLRATVVCDTGYGRRPAAHLIETLVSPWLSGNRTGCPVSQSLWILLPIVQVELGCFQHGIAAFGHRETVSILTCAALGVGFPQRRASAVWTSEMFAFLITLLSSVYNS